MSIEWTNTFIAIVGIIIAIIALWQARRSSRAAREANAISREANGFAAQANEHAKDALRLQEEEGQVRLLVEPRLLCLLGEGHDQAPRPVVKVVNISAFPVTIDSIHWKNNRKTKGYFYWKNPTIASPFGKLPARLPPRESLTALDIPTTFGCLDDLASVTAAVVYTACGERIEGMTEDWESSVARLVAEIEGNKKVCDE